MPKKILFVDDEPELCFMMVDYLRLYGYDVITAESAELALQLAGQTEMHAIILDVNLADLTGQDGAKLMTSLKQMQPATPIILYTGMTREDDEVKEMMGQGAYQYVSKGDAVDVLLRAVQNVGKATPPTKPPRRF